MRQTAATKLVKQLALRKAFLQKDSGKQVQEANKEVYAKMIKAPEKSWYPPPHPTGRECN